MDTRSIKLKLFDIIEPVAEDHALEVVDIGLLREGSGWVCRVYLDAPAREGDGGVSLSDCERMSRELSAILDVNDPIPCAYNLEVSSAGLDRPLRTRAHFERFRGETAKVKLESGFEGRKNFTGVIAGISGDTIELDVDGSPAHLPLSDIAAAKLVPNWDALMPSKRGR